MMNNKNKWLNSERLQVASILLLAAVLRIAFPGWTEFKADEARLLSLAWDMVEGQGVALRGISSSVGVPNFPASVWLYALPLFLVRHVYAPTIFTGLINAAAVGVTYYLVRRIWGRSAALAAALMMAVSPWMIIHSRKIWAQNLLSLFVVVWAFSGIKGLVEKRPRWLILHLVTAVFAFQIHLAAVALLLTSLVLVIVFWRSVRWLELVWAAGISMALTAPFLLFVSRSEYSMADLLSVGGTESTGGWGWGALEHAVRLFTGWQMHALAGPAAFADYLAGVLPHWPVIVLWLLLLLAGLWVIGRHREQEGRLRTFLLIWLVVPIATFLWFPTPVELHYLLPAAPALFVAAGIGFEAVTRSWRPIGWAVLLVSAGWQIYSWVMLLLFLVSHPTPGGFGEPLSFQLAAADYARGLVERQQVEEVLIAGSGEDPLLDGGAAIFDLHLRGVPHRFVDFQRSAVFPAAPAAVLVLPGRYALGGVYEATAVDVRRFPLRPDEGNFAVYTLPAAVAPQMATMVDNPPLLTNFVAILGHSRLETDGQWQLLWRVGQPGPADYHFFNHLFDFGGERVAQADEPAFTAGQWRAGDVVLSHFLLNVPVSAQRPFLMRSGMYRYPSLENVPVMDEAANPATDAVEFRIGP